MRYGYDKEAMEHITIRGIPCEFVDVRLNRDTVPEGKYVYEVADDSSDGEPCRIRPSILVDFYGTVVIDQELPFDEGDTIWLDDDDWLRVQQ